MTLKEILTQVQQGTLSPDAAGTMIRQDGYKEMDYAKLDTGRKARTGFAEVIYCSNKADEHLLKIFERLYHEEGEVLGTRASQSQYELVREKFPQVQYDPLSRILKIEKLTRAKSLCAQLAPQIFPLRRKLPRQQSILVPMWSGFMMWESAECTVCFPDLR